MTVPDNHIPCSSPVGAGRESPADRARRIAELKRQVQTGTYLIQRYEIIEGILDALSKDAD
jgi:anti-sigma28 factor (negative regulator of flagellin synthesis)